MFNTMEEDNDNDNRTTDRQRKWFEYVEMNKYFRAPLMHSQSVPCVRMRSVPAIGRTNLSLSWQLACNPADSSHHPDDCVQESHSKSDWRMERSLKCLKSVGKQKPKIKPINRKLKLDESPVNLPKIMVVDAIKRLPMRKRMDHNAYPEQLGDHNDHWMHEYRRNLEHYLKAQPYTPTKRINPKDRKEKTKPIRAKKPRAEAVNKPKRTYGVPLCHRPTQLLGPRYHHDLQHYNQQQYYYQLQQQQQQQQQQQMMQQQYYLRPMQHMSQPQQGYYQQGPRYEVPIESMYNNVRKGNRYCGNFYYR